MVIYAATTIRSEGRTDHYTDTPGELPSDSILPREYLFDPELTTWATILEAIRLTESEGCRITWDVNGVSYETGRRA